MKIIVLGSGSKGNSTLIVTASKKILIDAGLSFNKLNLLLNKYNYNPNDIDFILLTHTHKDHMQGLASFVKRCQTSIYIKKEMFNDVNKVIPKDYIIINEDILNIDNLYIRFLETSHDVFGVGYVIQSDKKSLIYITDTGYISNKNLEYMKDKNIYIIESNYDPKMLMDGPYPYILKQRIISDKGHLSNEMTGNYLNELVGKQTKRVVLMHLSETNNLDYLAKETVSNILNNNNIIIDVAKQNDQLEIEI